MLPPTPISSMPVETPQPVLTQPVRAAGTPNPNRILMPNRLLLQPRTAAAAEPRQSAVERLAADKAKYVKSQVAPSKQQPIKVPPPVMRKPLMSPATGLRPTRKTQPPRSNYTQQGSAPLDLEHLSNLINGMGEAETPPTAPTMDPVESSQAPDCPSTTTISPCPSPFSAGAAEGIPTPCPEWSTPVKLRINASGPLSPSGCSAAVTIRRVDVIPQHHHTMPVRKPFRARQQMHLPLQPMALHPHTQIHNAMSPLRLFHPRTTYAPGPASPKPVPAPPPQDHTPTPNSPSTPVQFPANYSLLPPSPSVTRPSSGSSRKRPSLTRSKSDMSDRYSRASTDLERFFNLCGLDPSEMQVLKGPGSDIVSLAQFRSASAPGSECAGHEGEEEEENGGPAEPAPYGVSVIERNARVIKWLYGIRQSKDTARSTNM
ncbi:protein FAM110A-like [Salvelinus alpinus]|uniref:protein FAM110A-like n=1 Tax=Salvelinus alpinus TaxID=8036 RepID=UPI0039FD6C5A